MLTNFRCTYIFIYSIVNIVILFMYIVYYKLSHQIVFLNTSIDIIWYFFSFKDDCDRL
jgi:hypothetical protein